MGLKDLAYLKFNSSFLRGILRHFYHDGDICTVRFGPLRGSRLVYHPSVNFHAILGIWDLDVFKFLNAVLRDGKRLGSQSIFADVGANIGLYSLWFARRVKRVYAFEPAPEARRMLAENIALNRAGNVSIVSSACSDRNGSTDFFIAGHHHSSSLHRSWVQSGESLDPARITVL